MGRPSRIVVVRLTVLPILCCSLASLAAHADEAMCRNGSFADGTSFGLAKVVGARRTYLRSDTAPCPDDSTACRGQSYVVPGDTVLTGTSRGGFVCAFYPGKRGGSAGYVRQTEIAAQPAEANPALSAWAGNWADGDDTISLRVRGSQLAATGNAYWPSADPSLKERPGGPNLGEMSGTAAPNGNTVVFAGKDADDCRVQLTLLPPYLLASDNSNCGGANVRFDGVYRKK
jgi:hypothetical protein